MNDIETKARAAREASRLLAVTPTAVKNRVLCRLADELDRRRSDILAANRQDVGAAGAAGLPEAKIRRLQIGAAAAEQMSAGLRQVAELPDPVGAVVKDYPVPSGLRVRKVRTPLGVVAMIYEARPNVTVDAFGLCFKAGNACLLKGGHEAAASNNLLAGVIHDVLAAERLPPHAVAVLAAGSREDTRHLLTLNQYIDLVIPRGGAELIRFVGEHARMPVVQHYQGVCHIYVDESARLEPALDICLTAKTSAPAACNAVECILVHEACAAALVPQLVDRYQAAGVEVRGDEAVCRLAPAVTPARADDWGREFLDLIVAVRVVPDLAAAIAHIETYGSNHTEAILSEDPASQAAFVERVGSSCVLVNASTRFNDGFQLGLGAEIGISTSKIHAYGPMGLEELTAQRFVVYGAGQTR